MRFPLPSARACLVAALPLICVSLLASASAAVLLKRSSGQTMVDSAHAFVETLGDAEKAVALKKYDDASRTQWHFIPKPSRKGLVIREMNSAQKAAAYRLMHAALSEAGYEKTRRIMMLEAVLLELEGPSSKGKRDPEKYYVTLFGEPVAEGTWGFSFEGHHLSLNFVVKDGQIVDSTPQFLASNPATVMSEVSGAITKGTRVLRDEEQQAFDLINSLTGDQRSQAVIAEEAPQEISGAGEPQPPAFESQGIKASELNKEQQAALRSLIDTYIDVMPAEVAAQRRQTIDSDGWNNLQFAWAGALKPGIGHYYRITSKSFVVEFVNVQADPAGNPANHIHCVWRDRTGDFNLPAEQ